jgi:hypothetical protein
MTKRIRQISSFVECFCKINSMKVEGVNVIVG